MRVRKRGEFEDNEIIRGSVSNTIINEELIERVDYICSDTILKDQGFKYAVEEMQDLTEEYRIAMNMSNKELAVFVCAAIDKFPMLVHQCLAESHLEALGQK